MSAPASARAAKLGGLDAACCDRAVQTRDARYDGQFVFVVRGTGVYCRPSCAAERDPGADIELFATTAAAQTSGFRACPRCEPDTAPGSPRWNGADAPASRAMRLLQEGAGEGCDAGALALRLGCDPADLIRSMSEEAGAGPEAVAVTSQVRTAILLLAETALPEDDIAHAAGFPGPAALADALQRVSGLRPAELRARTRRPQPGLGPRGIRVHVFLQARAPFDVAGILGFLAARAVAGVEEADGACYRRSLRLPHGCGVVNVRAAEVACGVDCDLALEDAADIAPALGRIRRLLDLDADPVAVDAALARDPALAPAVSATPGMRLPGAVDGDEILFRAIVGQQVSVAAARTALGRLAQALGEPLSAPLAAVTGVSRLFPAASAIAEHGRSVLRGPAQRIDTVIRLAHALASGELRLDAGQRLDELTGRLTEYKGIGPWSAGYVAMRVLGAPDVLLTGDAALRNGAARLGLPSRPAALAERAQRWAPWRSYAGMHLWASPRVASK